MVFGGAEYLGTVQKWDAAFGGDDVPGHAVCGSEVRVAEGYDPADERSVPGIVQESNNLLRDGTFLVPAAVRRDDEDKRFGDD